MTREPLHVQVAKALRQDIIAGKLRDGVALSSTRALARQWGVSVFTIAQAMKLLSAEGLVVSHSRSKRVVKAPTATSQDDDLQAAVTRLRAALSTAVAEMSTIDAILTLRDDDALRRP